uniref:Uncharacterized protein n=1 Tax=Anser brachyrhynchus TaxID=132585 RepID=A0A8B9CHK4_9AVES
MGKKASEADQEQESLGQKVNLLFSVQGICWSNCNAYIQGKVATVHLILSGSKGIQGPQGFLGLPGTQGPMGISGVKGEEGTMGPPGPSGECGDMGMKGL